MDICPGAESKQSQNYLINKRLYILQLNYCGIKNI